MTDELYNEACELVAQLLEVRSLREGEREFVADRHAKLEQYGKHTFMSEPQMEWLRKLAKKHYNDPRQMSFI